MLLAISVLCTCVVLSAGGRSPRAEYVEELLKIKAFGNRISDNIIEDALLDVPDLVRKYNYPLEEHFVTTNDGYILGMHRIPHGRDANNTPGPRPVVFLMHGLFSSSADYLVMGPGTALAYILADEGFDVWMGNARGNYYSRRHVRLNPDAIFNSAFWEFSWDEIGNNDLPAMIDYALDQTVRSGLHYIGLSQGTTVFFVMGSLRPEYNQKILSMHAMAPVAYMAHNRNPLFLLLAPHASTLASLASRFGIGEMAPRSDLITWAGRAFCGDGKKTQIICSGLIYLIGGFNPDQHNATMLPVKLGHAPAGGAFRQIAHYGQGIVDKQFRRYDFGVLRNMREYGSIFPTRYDLSKVSAPVYLHYAERDPLAHVNDVNRLFSELGNPMGMFRVSQRTFSHIDFTWGIDAKTFVFDRIIYLMRIMDSQA